MSEDIEQKVLLARAGAKRERKAMHQAIVAYGNRFSDLGVSGVPVMMGELEMCMLELLDAFASPDFQQSFVEHQAAMMTNVADLKRVNPKMSLVTCSKAVAGKMLEQDEQH